MGKIFCLMGKSGSGKDTIFQELKKDKNLKLKPVVPYTTRPKRSNETDGIEYYFINEKTLQEYKLEKKVIEQRVYDTINGKWYYCTLDDGQIDLNRGNYLLIVTLEAYKELKSYFGGENVVPIYITVDDGIRLERALKREKEQQNPNYDELCRRFLADSIDFNIDKLKALNIDKSYTNNNLMQCISDIKENILQFL